MDITSESSPINSESDKKTSSDDGAPSDEEILSHGRKRFKLCEEAEFEMRKEALTDTEFSIGEQWDKTMKARREKADRPCLVVNRLAGSIHQVTNAQRQSKSSIKISPVDNDTDIETAKARQAVIRRIEYLSDAPFAYTTALDCTARGGYGYWRVLTKYCDPMSFDQDIFVEAIPDQFSVRFDPFSKKPTGEDANYAFISHEFNKDDYKEEHPDSELSATNDWAELGSTHGGWIKEKAVQVSEYMFKRFRSVEIVLLSDGETVEKAKLPELFEFDNGKIGFLSEKVDQNNQQIPVFIVDERKTMKSEIWWAKINGMEVLEKRKLPGSGLYIPVIKMVGEDVQFHGRRITQGMVRQSRDPQRIYNYQTSNEAEAIALAPKAPYLIAEGQIEGYEKMWAESNRESFAYLPYKPTDHNGNMVPMPQRNAYEPAVQAITQSRVMAGEDLQYTSGVFKSGLGAQSNEVSGRAIKNRVAQGETSNFHFVDNMGKSICYTGKILNDWIPDVYDQARTFRITGDDGKEETFTINQAYERNGKQVEHRMDVGKYDVTVSLGPNFETKRQEATESILEFVRVFPQAAPFIGDLLAKNIDSPFSQEIAERLKKMLPPPLQDEKGKAPIPPEIEAQMAQMGNMIETLKVVADDKNHEMDLKRMELESKERIEFKKLETNVALEEFKAGSIEAIELLKLEVAELRARQELVGMSEPIESDFNDAAPSQGMSMNQQQPTGGPAPGFSMGDEP